MDFLIAMILYILLGLLINSIIPIPINDSQVVRYRSIPFATLTLILINTVVYVAWQAPPLIEASNAMDDLEALPHYIAYSQRIWEYGFRELYLTGATGAGAWVTFSAMFMHADFSHLTSNMLFLWAFGRRIEDATGPWRFLVFYLMAGMVSNMGYAFIVDSSVLDVPGIGASGAIFGVMGAYLLLFPTAKMGCLWLPAIIINGVVTLFMTVFGQKGDGWKWTIQIPALLVIGIYIPFTISDTFSAIETGTLPSNVNEVAHLSGFLTAITIFLFVRKDLLVRYMAGRRL